STSTTATRRVSGCAAAVAARRRPINPHPITATPSGSSDTPPRTPAPPARHDPVRPTAPTRAPPRRRLRRTARYAFDSPAGQPPVGRDDPPQREEVGTLDRLSTLRPRPP